MSTTDPYSGLDDELRALERAVAAYLTQIGAVIPRGVVRAAIRTGSARPILDSKQWAAEVERLAEVVKTSQVDLLTAGFRQGVAEVPGGAPALSERIAELAEQYAEIRATAIAEDIDSATRAGIRRSIARASREYAAGGQSLGALRRMEAEIRSMIGLTPKQAAQIERWRTAAVRSKMDGELIAKVVEKRTAAGKELRARGIADRGIVETVSYGRHQSWVEARDAGDLPANVMKVWIHSGDRRVRASHRAQAAVGPIPLDALFEIQGVMYPPSPDPGCRCHSGLVIP